MDDRKAARIGSARELKVYRKAFDAAMEIYRITKSFPKEETFLRLDESYEHIFAMLNSMEKKSDSFCCP